MTDQDPSHTRGEARMFIDGKLVEASSGRTFDNVNPATEEVAGPVADGSIEDMQTAIAAARRAFDETTWGTDALFRQHCLRQLRDAMEAEKEHLRHVVIVETGSPIAITYAIQVEHPIAELGYWADMITTFDYERDLGEFEAWGVTSKRTRRFEPMGVVGAITPWNYPLYLNIAECAPALAAGNTVILKPAPDTPWSATELGRLVAEHTDIPPGVFQVVTSSDHLVGQELATDPRVDMITFTGSTVTGRRILEKAAPTIKKVFLELGGKSAHIVCDDADFATVLPAAAPAVCGHAGQGCTLPTRILLPRSRYEEGVAILKTAFEAVGHGDPWDMANIQGPVISAKQRDKILGYMTGAPAQGARVVVGGGIPAGTEHGFFLEPTLLADVTPDSAVAQEEVFGPVLAVIAYDDDEDAIRIANDSMYGLSGQVSSASVERASAIANRLRTGTVSINASNWFAMDSPFGGYKQSGLGRRGGESGFEEYMESKTLSYPA